MTRLLKIAAVMIVGVACLALSSGTTSAGGFSAIVPKIVYECSANGPGTYTGICAIDPDGAGLVDLTGNGQTQSGPEISPDGRHIAWLLSGALYVMSPNAGGAHNVTDAIPSLGQPAWSPDSKQLTAFCDNPDNLTEQGFCIVDVATGDVHFGYPGQYYSVEDLSWSPDGKRLLFTGGQIATGDDLYVLDFGSGDVTDITNTDGKNEYGTWSADGSEIAFVGDPIPDDNDNDPFANLYRIDPNGNNRTLLYDPASLSTPHSNPAYSPDGQKIAWFCADPDSDICINDAASGALLDEHTEGENGLVTGANPDWGYTSGPIVGDLNCDGVVDGLDLTILIKYLGGFLVQASCPAIGATLTVPGVLIQYYWGVFSCSSTIEPNDALLLLLYLAGIFHIDPDCLNIGAVANLQT